MPETAQDHRDRGAALPPRAGRRAGLAELPRAVHRRHVGAAGPAVHQGRPRRHAELPLVVPHGDLRQLRDDGQRQAASCRARRSCATTTRAGAHRAARALPDRARPGRRRRATSSTSSRRIKPYIIPKAAAHARPTANTCRRRRSSTQYRAVSARASTACCATPPARSTGSTRRSPARRAGAAAPLQRRLARRRHAPSAWSSSTPRKASGVARGRLLLGGLPEGRRPGATRSTRTRSTARRTTSCASSCRRRRVTMTAACAGPTCGRCDGWWRRDPYFVRYMLREAPACSSRLYAVILLVGVWRLSQGRSRI